MPNPSWDPTGSWTSIFDDEFTGTSINTTYWGLGWQAKTGISGPINSGEAVSYTSANVSVSGGFLNLALTGTSGANGACVTTNTNGTGGTAGFAFTYPAAFECRANMPQYNGGIPNWTAIWLDGQQWPADGEIDIQESLGNGTTSSEYHVHDNAYPDGTGGAVTQATPYGWHTYGCYWTAGQISYYYDGVLVGSTPTDGFRGPLYIILNYTYFNLQSVPVTMQVDWVRVWTPG